MWRRALCKLVFTNYKNKMVKIKQVLLGFSDPLQAGHLELGGNPILSKTRLVWVLVYLVGCLNVCFVTLYGL